MAFRVRRVGERVEGLAPGIDPTHLERLRRGRTEPDSELDLHGLTSAEARASLEEALAEARRDGDRCVLVIHGRGARRASGPVLKDAVVDWLQAPPLSHAVLAFASALPRDGGPGALYVLLRRIR